MRIGSQCLRDCSLETGVRERNFGSDCRGGRNGLGEQAPVPQIPGIELVQIDEIVSQMRTLHADIIRFGQNGPRQFLLESETPVPEIGSSRIAPQHGVAPTLEKWLLKMPGDHVDESTRGYVLNEPRAVI